MNLQAGLSFDQAPPIRVPFRFFLSAPLFAAFAALLLIWQGASLLDSRWLPAVLAITHLMTLGFLGLTMMGAMMQMLPVVAGAPVARPVGVARTVHGLMLPGILALTFGFLFSAPLLIRAAMALLGLGLAVFIGAAAISLRRAAANPTAAAMRLAVAALLATAALGLTLASNHGWSWWLLNRADITNLHLAWGLLGWVGLLVSGVSYQVVPMFQMTPAYPKNITRQLAGTLFLLLLLWSLADFMPAQAQDALTFVAEIGIAIILALFAVTTLRLQAKRRRKISDVTLLFWRFGMSSLLLALFAWLVIPFFPELSGSPRYPFLLAILFIVGFAVSVVNGMLYKIAPFLIWFHLQSQLMGIAKVPNMKEILSERRMKRQMWLHFTAATLLALALAWPPLIYPAGLLFVLSMLWLEGNLLSAYAVYRRNLKLVA